MNDLTNMLIEFERKYFEAKRHKFYKPQSREFLYDCIINNIYNTELVLCIDWIKPVSKFIIEKFEHIDFIKTWLKEKWIYLEYRKLKQFEESVNINDRINYIIYTWRDETIVKDTLKWDIDNSAIIWELLWYPHCCSEKWDYNWVIWKEKNFLDFFNNYISWDNLPLLNNPFFNFVSTSLAFYYPCRLECEESLKMHEKFAEVIRRDNPDFMKKIETFFALPILFILPTNPSTLSFNLHFDEIFRVFFIWIKKWDTIFYKDFFIVSYSFLDQSSDENYKNECVKVLELLIDWDRAKIINDELHIWKGDLFKKCTINYPAKIIQFNK